MKTGTTAIQEILANHDDSVILYPKVGLFRNAHHQLVYNFLGKNRQLHGCTNVAKGELLDVFEESAKRTLLNVVISTEWLGSHSSRDDISAFMHAVASRVAGGPPDVEILLACREHFDRAGSLYGQRLKGGAQWAPDDFIRENSSDLCYAPLITNLMRTGYKVTPLNYHPSLDWVSRFLGYVGFPADRIPEASNANRSFAPWVLVARMASNRILAGNDSQMERTRQRIIRNLKRVEGCYAAAQFIFSKDIAAEMESVFREDRIFLSKEFGIQLPTPQIGSQENMFFVDLDSFEYITDAVGSEQQGKQILEIVSQYIRA